MCDYSLEMTASRPAEVGDSLVSTKFCYTSTRGFAAADDPEKNVAVCLAPGTELAFAEEITTRVLGRIFPTGHLVARFCRINRGLQHAHHDALEFPDGQVVLLTDLTEDQHATVLQLPAGEPRVVEDAPSRASAVAL